MAGDTVSKADMPANYDQSLADVLNRNLDDIDLILRQIIEIAVVPKQQRAGGQNVDVVQLALLLQLKDGTLRSNVQLAEEHIERQKIIDKLRLELKRRDADIEKLQKCLKEAESVLTTAIFQANQKLKSINTANQRKVSAEELIRFAHKISASNAVAAPDSWQPGDPQRPYPTDKEMRGGILARLSLPGGLEALLQQQGPSAGAAAPDLFAAGGGNFGVGPQQLGPGFARQFSGPGLAASGSREDLSRMPHAMFSQQQSPFYGGMMMPHPSPQQQQHPHHIMSQPGTPMSGGQPSYAPSLHSVPPGSLPFGSPASSHHGSAPSTPTQPLAGGWSSPRGPFPGPVHTPPQYQGHGSPRVRLPHMPGGGSGSVPSSPLAAQLSAGVPPSGGPHMNPMMQAANLSHCLSQPSFIGGSGPGPGGMQGMFSGGRQPTLGGPQQRFGTSPAMHQALASGQFHPQAHSMLRQQLGFPPVQLPRQPQGPPSASSVAFVGSSMSSGGSVSFGGLPSQAAPSTAGAMPALAKQEPPGGMQAVSLVGGDAVETLSSDSSSSSSSDTP